MLSGSPFTYVPAVNTGPISDSNFLSSPGRGGGSNLSTGPGLDFNLHGWPVCPPATRVRRHFLSRNPLRPTGFAAAFIAIVALGLALLSASAATWHVDPKGDDSKGTGSAELPWKNIQKALEECGPG
ncbi:MAG: hypothetical protein JWL81_1535, partial [Verrucomicrobiales bacterium]|nr:hypothetical protein [Verrucomicrobiales bacterium]